MSNSEKKLLRTLEELEKSPTLDSSLHLAENNAELKSQIELLRDTLDQLYSLANKHTGELASQVAKISDDALLKTGYESLLNIRKRCVIEVLPAIKERPRKNWTNKQWAEHVGGRYHGGNPLNYYEFGSMFAVGELIKQVHVDGQKSGWNQCIYEVSKAAGVSDV